MIYIDCESCGVTFDLKWYYSHACANDNNNGIHESKEVMMNVDYNEAMQWNCSYSR